MGPTGIRDHSQSAFRRALAVAVLVTACVAGGTRAQEETRVLGVDIGPPSGTYQVLKGVNVRARPYLKGKRVAKLKKGSQIQVLGKVKGSPWLAVTRDGKALGFVYAPALLPLIDGALAADLTGRTPGEPGPACRYTIRFEGKSSVEGNLFKTADYEVEFSCPYKAKDIKFSAFMFITEAPYQMSVQNPVHQISVDLRQVGEGFEENFSTNLFYHPNTSKLVFDGITLKHYARPSPVKEAAAATVPQALVAAVRMAVAAWNEKVWQELAEGCLL